MMNMTPNNWVGMMPNAGMGMRPSAVPPGFVEAMGDPEAILKRIDLTPAALQDPNAAIQSLMNSGRMTQEQYNSLYQRVQGFKNDPQVQRMLAKMTGR